MTHATPMLSAIPLAAGNDAYVEAMYEQFLAQPESVDPRWREYFASLGPTAQDVPHRPLVEELARRARAPRVGVAAGAVAPAGSPPASDSVAAKDGPGRGSTFALRLPLGRTDVSRRAVRASSAAANYMRRVLIVDDNEDAAEALAMLVTDLGGAACTASDGFGGLERIGDFEPEIVLLDLGMPGMDGFETCRRMREAGSRAYIVALTGWGQDKDRDQVMRSGFDAHLTKPADPAQLEDLLATGRLKK